MLRRARRDSETSTDSWSLVEETDNLDDDLSLNSADNEEVEPIIEEVLTSDDDDTASEKSLDSESGDSEDSETDDVESDVDEDSDECDDSKSEYSENDVTYTEHVIQDDEMSFHVEYRTPIQDAAIRCKENEQWMDYELEDYAYDINDRRGCRLISVIVCLFMSIFFIKVFGSLTESTRNHPALPSHIFNGYSLQSYNKERKSFELKEEEKASHNGNEHLLKNVLNRANTIEARQTRSTDTEELFANNTYQWKTAEMMERVWKCGRIAAGTPDVCDSSKNAQFSRRSSWKPIKKCRALAPVPPAPFTPRKVAKRPRLPPHHQPCFVHVNQSKWLCQKRSALLLNEVKSSKWDFKKRSTKPLEEHDICGRKASQSMRTAVRPADQCDSRHFSQYTPHPRRRIAFKTPLPCKVTAYKPTMPKPTRKPSSAFSDWHQKRSQLRAQLRSRA